MEYVRSLRPQNSPEFNEAWSLLRASDRTRIAHLDAGLAAHEGIGWMLGAPIPANLRVAEGRNVFDAQINGDAPLTRMTLSNGLAAGMIEWPDHGIKTLSVLMSDNDHMRGVIPGATIVPYRVANGPLFRYSELAEGAPRSATAAVGRALELAMGAAVPARVASISMGNPGMGPVDFFRGLLGGDIGMARETGKAVDRAWEGGMIIVCAAGQIINTVVYPARYARTIAVGGYDKFGGLLTHYPPQGYQDPDRVDIWAQACAGKAPTPTRSGQKMTATAVIRPAHPMPRPKWRQPQRCGLKCTTPSLRRCSLGSAGASSKASGPPCAHQPTAKYRGSSGAPGPGARSGC
jgi:hypothetical protein